MKPEQAAELLGRTGIFGDLDRQTLLELARRSDVRSYRKGQLIFNKGDVGDSFFVVVDGLVKIFVLSEDGNEMVLTTLRPPDTLGELAVIDGRPRSASAEAIQHTTLLALGRATLLDLLGEHPPMVEGLLRSLGSLIRRLTEQTADLVFLDLAGRVAKLVLGLAEAEGKSSDDGLVLDLGELKMTQSDIAGMVGASRQSVSEVLHALEARGFIERQGRKVIVRDVDALRRRAAP